MFGPHTIEREKVLESYPFKSKAKESYQIKIKPKSMIKEMFILNILTVKEIIKYEMLRDNMSYKQATRNRYLCILPTAYYGNDQDNFLQFCYQFFSQ